MSASLINRSLTTIRTELDFLKESNVISEEKYDEINSSLPERYEPHSRASPVPTESTGEDIVEVLYRFDPQQDGDLAIMPGDRIQVLERISPEWYKGKCNGKIGVFPSNYVKSIASSISNASRTSVVPPPQYLQPQKTVSSYQSSQYQAVQQAPQQAPFPPQSTNYYQQQPQQPQQQMVQQEQPQQQQHHSGAGKHLKSFGSKLGNAAIFGAGATIGSDIVNSIF